MPENPNLEGAMERVKTIQAKREAKRAAKEAERKIFWDEYNEQLAKSTPNQGGAHARRERVFRFW